MVVDSSSPKRLDIFRKFRFFNRTLALSVLLIAISTFNYGFDNQAFATTQAMDSFQKQFGSFNPKTQDYYLEPSWLSLFNSLNYIGLAAGVLIGSLVSARFGRKWCMAAMSAYALVTATIAVTSMNRNQIMAARILNYVYVGMELAVIPTYQSEIVPSSVRGLVVGSYHMSLVLGGLVINSVCFGTSKISDNRAWRIPVGLFYIVPSIILAGIFFVPESPRWLLRQDRVEEARASLQRLRRGPFTDEQIADEFRELQYSLEADPEQGNFLELFTGKNLKRTAVAAMVNCFQQASGQAFASQYGAIYVKSLKTINPFAFSLITISLNVIMTITLLPISDRVGRKPLLMASSAIMGCALMTMGGLGTANPITDREKQGVVAMLAVMAVGFATGWGPMPYVVTSEVSALRLRDHTSRLGFGVNVLFNFLVNFSIPYLIDVKYAGLGSKVGFIFGSIAFTGLVCTYLFVPECKGKTLEQIDLLFNSDIPLRSFGKTDAAAMMMEATGNIAHKVQGESAAEADMEAGKQSNRTTTTIESAS